ncbi:MAG: DUF839 domain-containing protein, partial [Planctomycetes bacterium]|nr:DUF839 domain-containing protein [Planctomycetota bacterium]
MLEHDENPQGSNPTQNPELTQLIEKHLSRRNLLGGALAVTAAQFLFGRGVAAQELGTRGPGSGRGRRPRMGFTEVPASSADDFIVPPGYVAQVIVPWGTPLWSNAAPFAEDASNSAADQELQVGFNHDGMHYFPLWRGPLGNRRGLLVLNHEYTDANQIYSAAVGRTITNDAAGREKVAKALAGHGVSVIEIQRDSNGNWSHVIDSPYNRRITGTTPMAFSGPVSASHPMLQSAITPNPRGTLNNCAHGFTPWGTYLACEENWNGYFGTADSSWTATALEARYGVSRGGFGYNWHVAEPRFDIAVNRNELNHFG